jgi:hypothetical protein
MHHSSALQQIEDDNARCTLRPLSIPDQPRDTPTGPTRRAPAAGRSNDRPLPRSQEHDFWQESE